MFDVGFTELLLLFVIGLLILGPERLPRVAAQVGRWVARARRTANQLRMQIEREVALDEIREAQRRVKTTVEGKGESPPPGSADAAGAGAADAAADGGSAAPEAAGEPRPPGPEPESPAGRGTGAPAGEVAGSPTETPADGTPPAPSAGEEGRPSAERSTHA